jgi:cytoskeletal protein CcmA (bactofilin family)
MNQPGFLMRIALGAGLAKRTTPSVRMQNANDTPPPGPALAQARSLGFTTAAAAAGAPASARPRRPEAAQGTAETQQRHVQGTPARPGSLAGSLPAKTAPQIGDGLPTRGSEQDIGTVIPAAASLTGDLHINESIVLQCVVHGNVTQEGDHQVVLTATGGIHGTLRAQTAVIGGTVEGDVFADRIVVLESGVIVGNVEYTTLAMKEGATINGTLTRVVPNVVGFSEGASATILRAVPVHDGERVA